MRIDFHHLRYFEKIGLQTKITLERENELKGIVMDFLP